MFCFSDVGIYRYEIYFKMNLGTYPTLLGVIDIQNTFRMPINAVFTLVWTDVWRVRRSASLLWKAAFTILPLPHCLHLRIQRKRNWRIEFSVILLYYHLSLHTRRFTMHIPEEDVRIWLVRGHQFLFINQGRKQWKKTLKNMLFPNSSSVRDCTALCFELSWTRTPSRLRHLCQHSAIPAHRGARCLRTS